MDEMPFFLALDMVEGFPMQVGMLNVRQCHDLILEINGHLYEYEDDAEYYPARMGYYEALKGVLEDRLKGLEKFAYSWVFERENIFKHQGLPSCE